jgi:FixJ family two-component response regulator
MRLTKSAPQPYNSRPLKSAFALTASDPTSGTVFVIDDDASIRRALARQLRTAGFDVHTFASAQHYLDQAPQTGIACIVTDVRMPGLSGLDLQASLAEARRELPMVFITGHGDIPTSVQAMKAGAVNFLPKPFTDAEILVAVSEALAQSRALDGARRQDAELHARYQSLTPREREVFALVAAGLLNKLVADRLAIAEKTVKIHRGRVMEKMGAASVADLVRMARRLPLPPGSASSPG